MLDRLAFTAMTGARHAMNQLSVTTNNLANAQTPGFREMLSTFRAVPIQGGAADSRAFVVDSTPGFKWDPGAIIVTGNPLDVAIQREGMFAVRAADGQEAYTRGGRFTLDAEGMLRNPKGHAVLDENSGEIFVPADVANVTVSATGELMATLNGTNAPLVIAKLKLVNPLPGGLERRGDGYFDAIEGELYPDAGVRVQAGSLESSNVNLAEAMVQMIQQNRMFDLNMKMIQTADQNAKSTSALMSLSRI